ncbi:MAG: HAMP domain-containing histidine kinase [Treponema sp.]|jgi:signal transduction histidine kinase|nr:HAMP domain-containing histidine kinase [Treponema sp.]
MKIRTQFYLLITGIIAVPLLAILVQYLFFEMIRREEREERINDSLPAYEEVAEMLDGSMSPHDWEGLVRLMSRAGRNTDFAVFRGNRQIVFSTIPELAVGELARSEKLIDMVDKRHSFVLNSPPWLEGRGFVLSRIVQEEQPPPPKGRFRFYPQFFVIVICIMIVLFAVVMSFLIAGSITKSVQALENATRRIAAGDLDLKVDVRGSNEITSLTASLNQMRDELKEAERRRARFIMGVTHDLKTPLALIRGYAEAIEDGISPSLASGEGATGIIKSKVDQLEGMINDLIDYVRMDSGEWRSQLKDVDLHKFLTGFAERFIPDAELFQHKMHVDIRLPQGLTVPIDEKLMVRAFENLVNNAIRFTPQGTVISLEAGKSGGSVCITVRDNGPGIAAQDLPHIFETFYRGSSSRREQGIGLGLAVVKWVIDFHGWTIKTLSNTNKESGDTGTRFIIEIPL